ncbi:MAG TPA: lipid-binding SYLF domain-containing protein [Noviherbaspirillum sp.]|nr:lipid-binding SYLF domain-containing protein [Noviherbaspirillum sp.]
MTKHDLASHAIATACTLVLASLASASFAQSSTAPEAQSGSSAQTGSARSGSREADDAMKQVNDSVNVVKKMESDPEVRKLLQQAKGVFIIPHYGRGALGVGAEGGEGVVLANNNGKWSNPGFYNFGGVSVGLQAGAEAGPVAMILMNEKAVNNFMQDNKFSLTADAGLTIVNYKAKGEAAAGRGDVVVWRDTKGALADVAIGVTDVNFDDDENKAFYKAEVSPKDIISGKARSNQAAQLIAALPSGRASGATASGSSGESSTGASGTSEDTSGSKSRSK